jgi:hypothetical protein
MHDVTNLVGQTHLGPQPVMFSLEEAAAIVGLLRLIEPKVTDDARPLSRQVRTRVERRVRDSSDVDIDATPTHLTTAETEALRLTRLLESCLDDVGTIIGMLETTTEPDQRPLLMIAASRLTARDMMRRIDRLSVAI